MLFKRKTFVDVIKSMTPYDNKLYFRDSVEKGMFEVLCLKKTRFSSGMVLMKAVFQTEDASIFSDNVSVIGEPFYADAQNVLTALAGKEAFAEYKDGFFDGISVYRGSVPLSDNSDYRTRMFRELVLYHDGQKASGHTLTISAGQHHVIARNIKDFPSEDETRSFMNTVHIHFNAEDDVRIVATDGRSLAVYQFPGKFDEALLGTWTVSPDMLYVPPYNYESVTYDFSKEVVSASIHGRPDDPVITVYDVPLEWRRLKDLRKDLKEAILTGRKTQEEVDEAIQECIDQGPQSNYPNYLRVIPENNTENIVIDRNEITLGLEKLKRSLYADRSYKSKIFIIDALDPENKFLTSMTNMDSWGISYIDSKLPLKKVEVSHPIRLFLNVALFEKCCLEGSDKAEFRIQTAKRALITEGVDFSKGCSVNVKKIFMPYGIPDSFGDYGEDPKKEPEPEPEQSEGSEEQEESEG
jgi:hypothetical protein